MSKLLKMFKCIDCGKYPCECPPQPGPGDDNEDESEG